MTSTEYYNKANALASGKEELQGAVSKVTEAFTNVGSKFKSIKSTLGESSDVILNSTMSKTCEEADVIATNTVTSIETALTAANTKIATDISQLRSQGDSAKAAELAEAKETNPEATA